MMVGTVRLCPPYPARVAAKRKIRRDFATVGHGVSFFPAERRVLSERPPAPEDMAEWFLANYEDPANQVPYVSKEGGYQYYSGGPYDAEEELQEHFPTATEEDLQKAIGIVEQDDGPEWVRKAQYP